MDKYKISKNCRDFMKRIQNIYISSRGGCSGNSEMCKTCLLCCLKNIGNKKNKKEINIDELCTHVVVYYYEDYESIKIINTQNNTCDIRGKDRKSLDFILSRCFVCDI